MNEEKYFRVSDLRKLCDDSRDWGVPTFTLNDLVEHGHWTDRAKSILGLPTEACSECAEWSVGYKKDYCPNCGAKMDEDEWQEPEINPCRGCDDYDGQGGCKSNGGCWAEIDEVEE